MYQHLSIVLLACLAAHGQTVDPSKLDMKISALLNASGAPSVSVAVVQDDKLVYAKAFGQADLEAHREADTKTRYAVGSISKQFTAAAILLAQEEGKLSLDDKVGKYLPGLTRANEVTIRQVLSHTAGYEDFAPQDYIIPEWKQPTTAEAILEKWAKKPLNFDPGTRWQYSNTGYVVAGAVFEKATGEKLVPFLQKKIFRPLGMSSAGDCDERSPVDAKAYTRYALGPVRSVDQEGPGWYFAAGELCMTPSDLSKWDVAFLERKILSARSYDEFTREVILKDGNRTRYGLGMNVSDIAGTPVFSHGGEVSGFLASNQIFPTRKSAVIVLSNADGLNLVSPLANELAQYLLNGERAAAPETEIAEVRTILQALQQGLINRKKFTANANSYFNEVALGDYQGSLSALGTLQSIVRLNESFRGGMIHRSYRGEFEKKAVLLNVYVLPDGRYEQFLVTEQR